MDPDSETLPHHPLFKPFSVTLVQDLLKRSGFSNLNLVFLLDTPTPPRVPRSVHREPTKKGRKGQFLGKGRYRSSPVLFECKGIGSGRTVPSHRSLSGPHPQGTSHPSSWSVSPLSGRHVSTPWAPPTDQTPVTSTHQTTGLDLSGPHS